MNQIYQLNKPILIWKCEGVVAILILSVNILTLFNIDQFLYILLKVLRIKLWFTGSCLEERVEIAKRVITAVE